MRILGRYTFREVFSSALLGSVLATFVVFLQGPGKKLFEVLVRNSASPETVAKLFLLAVPPVLPLTIPFGVLVGILIGLGRLASDGEITAMRAAGVSSRKIVPAVLAFAILAGAVAGSASLWMTPLAARSTEKILRDLAAAQLTADIEPRIFDEQFPNTILYVGEVRPGAVVTWLNVFIADLTPPESRQSGLKAEAEGPRITIARQALATPDVKGNRIQLSMEQGSTHEVAKDSVGYHSIFASGDQVLEAAPPAEVSTKAFVDMLTPELWRFAAKTPKSQPDSLDARVELNRRLSLPFACLTLALVGIPLGIATRKGGKSAGYVMGILLAFFCYYLAYISLIGLAKQRAMPVEVASWTPNALFGLAGIVMISRMELAGDRDFLSWLRGAYDGLRHWLSRFRKASENAVPNVRGAAPQLLLQIVDSYVLSSFLFYFSMLLLSFVLMTQVYNFFELLSSIVKNQVPLSKVFTYLFFLTPKLIYDTLPISVLVGVLVTFGVLTKNNEITAFKACGVSLRRLAIPVLLISAVLSVGLFAFDYYLVPAANLKQDALRNEIKGLPTQTYLRPDRKWIFGNGPRIYYYKYFEPVDRVMAGVLVYELDEKLFPLAFQLKREIGAERAQWQPGLKTWVFQNGWSRDLDPRGISETKSQTYQVTTFPELNEPPEYFLKEVKQDKQMNYAQLGNYIQDLQQSGFDTVKLRVQLYKKFAVPLFALIMAMISIPFGFLVGNRGAMAGIGVSIGIAILYWGIGQFFEQLGNVNHLPPLAAAWAPDVLFGLAGAYLLLRMRT